MAALDPDDSDSIETADLIADALVVPDGHDRHWSDSAQNADPRRHSPTSPPGTANKGRRDLPTVRTLILHGSIDPVVDVIDRDGCD